MNAADGTVRAAPIDVEPVRNSTQGVRKIKKSSGRQFTPWTTPVGAKGISSEWNNRSRAQDDSPQPTDTLTYVLLSRRSRSAPGVLTVEWGIKGSDRVSRRGRLLYGEKVTTLVEPQNTSQVTWSARALQFLRAESRNLYSPGQKDPLRAEHVSPIPRARQPRRRSHDLFGERRRPTAVRNQ